MFLTEWGLRSILTYLQVSGSVHLLQEVAAIYRKRYAKTVYLIRWLRASKPIYYLGEVIQSGEKMIPGPAQQFQSLNFVLQVLKRKYDQYELRIMTMGFTEEELHTVDQFRIANHNVVGVQNIPKPLGKKGDGSLYRVFMVDSNLEVLRELRKILLPQHFEIVGIARNGSQAYDIFQSRHRVIDILFVGAWLGDCTGYQLVEECKKVDPDLITAVLIDDKQQIDYPAATRLVVNFHLMKPIQEEEVLEKIKAVFS